MLDLRVVRMEPTATTRHNEVNTCKLAQKKGKLRDKKRKTRSR
jgi:hypothetical protein